MECYITLSIECDKAVEEKIRLLVDTFGNYDKLGSQAIAKSISTDLVKGIDGLYENYGEILEDLHMWGKKKVQIRGTGSSNTHEFMHDFMDAIGPHVDTLKGSYRHDDEDGDRPERFIYTKSGIK